VLCSAVLHPEGEPDVAEGELFFVPTAALALLDILHRVRPNHRYINMYRHVTVIFHRTSHFACALIIKILGIQATLHTACLQSH